MMSFLTFYDWGGEGGVLRKTMLQVSLDNETWHMFVPAKKLPCAKFGCYSSISDITMTSSIFLQQQYRMFCMLVNQVLFHYENFASMFDFLEN